MHVLSRSRVTGNASASESPSTQREGRTLKWGIRPLHPCARSSGPCTPGLSEGLPRVRTHCPTSGPSSGCRACSMLFGEQVGQINKEGLLLPLLTQSSLLQTAVPRAVVSGGPLKATCCCTPTWHSHGWGSGCCRRARGLCWSPLSWGRRWG